MIPKTKYQEILKLMPRPCVDVILRCNGKFLLGHRAIEPDKGKWGLFGGQVKMGETTEEAVIRKVKQEVGLSVDYNTVKLLGIFTCFGETRQDICMTYEARIDRIEGIMLDYQHDKYCWVDKTCLPLNTNQFVLKQLGLIGDRI